ncbi:hypothetical protein [Thermaurantiacus sp.]
MLLVSLIVNWMVQFLSPRPWRWDIEHFLYFGRRLIAGELHWTGSFDDKLPVVQFIFALPGVFDSTAVSMAVWLAVSACFVLLGAWACYVLVEDALRADPNLTRDERVLPAAFAAMSMVYLCSFLPAGLRHVNTAAAGAAVASIALLAIACRARGPGLPAWLPLLASALLASIAIGIRPYLLPPLLAAPLWALARVPDQPRLRGLAVGWVVWTAATAIFGLIVNVLPYVVTGQLEAFLAGMRLLSQELRPRNMAGTLEHAFSTFRELDFIAKVMAVGAVAAPLYTAATLWRRTPGRLPSPIARDILVLSLALPLLLAASIAAKHFWDHYLQMFSPFLAMGFGFLCYIIAREVAGPDRLLGSLVGAVALLSVLPTLASDGRQLLGNRNFLTVRGREAEAVAAFLRKMPADRRDFLYLDNMFVHWRLKEPRHGFPHAANTVQIIRAGWWQSVEMPGWFAHPTNAQAYCHALDEAGPSLLIVGEHLPDFPEICTPRLSRYRLIHALDGGTRIFGRS